MEFFFQILLVFVLVLLNGYFVASEFSLVAVRKTRVDELARKGNLTAKILQKALNDLDSYISATQLGITLASLALGWIGEPAIAHVIEPHLQFLPDTISFLTAHTISVIIAFSIITFLHIVLGELAPKTVALQRAEATALIIIAPLILFTKLFRPFIWILNGAGQLVLRPFGLSGPSGHQLVHSEEEIKMILTQSTQGGAIESKEAEILYNVFQLGDTPVKLIMIPRTDTIAFNVGLTIKDVLKKIEHHPHSRFPLYEGSIDSIVGFVHIKDMYKELLKNGGDNKLSRLKIIREIISVPENKKIDQVLSDMRKKRIHIAVVHDEFGGTSGIVTLEDIIESVIGDIEDEFDKPVKNIERQKDNTYIIQGNTPIDDIREKFKLPLKGEGYTTIGGLVFGLLGHEPRVDDTVQISKIQMHVTEIDKKRIKTLRLKKIAKG